MKSLRVLLFRRLSIGVACALLLMATLLVVGCDNSSSGSSSDNDSGDDDDGQSDISIALKEVDDCGFPIVPIPEGCNDCHKTPPDTARHPENRRCYRCHGYVVGPDMQFVQAELHNNGKVEVAVGCSSCHGWDQGVAPPQNLHGLCGDDKPGVGSHAAMRRSPISAHRVNCSNCHLVPTGTWEPGHIDGDGKAEVQFKNLATLHDAQATWDGAKCSNVYCHGSTLEGGTATEPVWGDNSGKYSACGACHRITDPSGNADADCHSCHATSVDAQRNILRRGVHMNGVIDMATPEKGDAI